MDKDWSTTFKYLSPCRNELLPRKWHTLMVSFVATHLGVAGDGASVGAGGGDGASVGAGAGGTGVVMGLVVVPPSPLIV